MGWHQNEIGAMVFFSVGTDFQQLVKDLAAHKPNDVEVKECVVLLGFDQIICRLHANPGQKAGAERIAEWVNSVITSTDKKFAGHFTSHPRTYVVGFEAEGGGAKAS